jgi:hypothetical protein
LVGPVHDERMSTNGVKLLLDTLKTVDGGKVVCEVLTPEGTVVRGAIEQSFFEDFMGVPEPRLSDERKSRIVQENVAYLEGEATRLLHLGFKEVVIR